MFTHQIGVVESCKIIVFFLDNPRSVITFCSRRLPLISCHPFRPRMGGGHRKHYMLHGTAITVKYQKLGLLLFSSMSLEDVIARLAHQNAGSMWCYDAPEPIRAPGYPL
ncbi:hypothetical protein PAHAL_4G200500 [Panicum hallii]|uniref:Uncharacterized protein n=1 Tax=Panicum hallii TaxID=206008 RepID=A0A2T8JDH9_9POAL|nr:hypothetical protein PAHAL_4G200500 [Panicum hallii]